MNGLIGTASVTINANTAPSGGYCYFKEYPVGYSFEDTIFIETDSTMTELNVICTGWNDEDLPLTQNVKMVHSTMTDSCLSYGILTAASYDWNRCRGSLLSEFEEYKTHLI